MFENIVLNQTRSSDPKGIFGMHQGMLLDSTTNKILAVLLFFNTIKDNIFHISEQVMKLQSFDGFRQN